MREAAGKRRRTAPWEITSCEHDAAEQAHRSFQVERHAVECEFDAHCSKPAAVKAFEPLAFAQFGEARFHDRFAPPVSGARQRMLEQRCHPFSKFLAGIAFELAAAQRISALATQWAAVALTPAPILAVSGAERILLLVGKTEFAARRTMINIPR